MRKVKQRPSGFHFFQPLSYRPTTQCVVCDEEQDSSRHIVAKALNEEALCPRR